MINLSTDFDLGNDRIRIQNLNDRDRQTVTAAVLLNRFFDSVRSRRTDLQVLADEVGMGKTYVALAVAYSLLAHLKSGSIDSELAGCYRKVLILTPANEVLFRKWRREVEEFVQRCVLTNKQDEARNWFKPVPVSHFDELVNELRRPGGGASVIIAKTGVFGRFTNYDLKRRVLLGVLFRFWGNRIDLESRSRLLLGAPSNWTRDPYDLTHLTDSEEEKIAFTETELLGAIDVLSRQSDIVERLLNTCRAVAQPYVRDREALFQAGLGADTVEKHLDRVYRAAVPILIGSNLPLVVVDEAHNWKHGPSAGANGFRSFASNIAPNTRRALLLTATPFQIKPEELVEILKVSDHLKPCPTNDESEPRRARLRNFRENLLRGALDASKRVSRSFYKQWARLPESTTPAFLTALWNSDNACAAREDIEALLKETEQLTDGRLEKIVARAIGDVDPGFREFVNQSLHLFAYNRRLSQVLGRIMIRHRRSTSHRVVSVGDEFKIRSDHSPVRHDGHILHAAAGIDVRGTGELPHYLLMRCVSEMKRAKKRPGRSSLGSTLTGCYSTLLASAEGCEIPKWLEESSEGGVYFSLLHDLVDQDKDPSHPKVASVVERVLQNWRNGEKSLIFCSRINTAQRLHEIIDDRIRNELKRMQIARQAADVSLVALRGRFTGSEGDLIGLGLDRVLWSYYWSDDQSAAPFSPDDLKLRPTDFIQIARLATARTLDLSGDKVNRVFINRSVEHILARRILATSNPTGAWKRLLFEISDERWVDYAYGWEGEHEDDGSGVERADFDERGVHRFFEPNSEHFDESEVQTLATRLTNRWQRAQEQHQIGIFDSYWQSPSLWFGVDPASPRGGIVSDLVRKIHSYLRKLSEISDTFDWNARRRIFQALRRALLRESVLLRILPERTKLEEQQWGELLADAFFQPLPGQRESMMHRVAVLLEDLVSASGSVEDAASSRGVMIEATRLRDQQFVALVTGGQDQGMRDRVIAGFNTPLLPEVLVCTTVGHEGIDLHRHCRNIIHHDLDWDPTKLEQRTGRIDRIGSQTFRERAESKGTGGPFLEVGVPFLAGTYDERMYEEVRVRAQVFDILTGGELVSEDREGRIALPEQIVSDLRVKLSVWQGPSDKMAHQIEAVGVGASAR
jgi:superfamily II DNA or RNA helicase